MRQSGPLWSGSRETHVPERVPILVLAVRSPSPGDLGLLGQLGDSLSIRVGIFHLAQASFLRRHRGESIRRPSRVVVGFGLGNVNVVKCDALGLEVSRRVA